MTRIIGSGLKKNAKLAAHMNSSSLTLGCLTQRLQTTCKRSNLLFPIVDIRNQLALIYNVMYINTCTSGTHSKKYNNFLMPKLKILSNEMLLFLLTDRGKYFVKYFDNENPVVAMRSVSP